LIEGLALQDHIKYWKRSLSLWIKVWTKSRWRRRFSKEDF